MNKIATDIDQSKKLAEILPIESADMVYSTNNPDLPTLFAIPYKDTHNKYFKHIPAWSLTALIEILPSELWINKHYFFEISKMGDNSTPYEVRYYRFKEDWECAGFNRVTHISCSSDNLIDACYEMIILLHENNLL